MADTKITGYTELAAKPAAGDLVETVDVSDATMSAGGTNKKITASNLAKFCATDGTALTDNVVLRADGTDSQQGSTATLADDGKLTVAVEDAGTNTVLRGLRIRRTSSDTPAAGIGSGMEIEVETSAGTPGNLEVGGAIELVSTDVTSTSEDFDWVFRCMEGGAAAAEAARFKSYGGVVYPDGGSASEPQIKAALVYLRHNSAGDAGNWYFGYNGNDYIRVGTAFVSSVQIGLTGGSLVSPDVALARVAAGQIAVLNATNGQATNIKTSATTVNLSGATSTATGLFPAQCIQLGVTVRVTTTVTGATSFDIGDGTDVDRYGATIALTSGTTVNLSDATADPRGWAASAGDVVFTANGSNFTGGVVRVVAHFLDLTAPTS